MSTHVIRLFGDPVLKARAAEVVDIDGRLASLAGDMVETMYAAPGMGLAATQVGVQKRMFVYDVGDGPLTLINPEIVESRGEFVYDEGCLSVPGLRIQIARPKELLVRGVDLDGNEVSFEAEDVVGRVIQHELDHLDGVLLLERCEPHQRKQALKLLRRWALEGQYPGDDGVVEL